MTRMTITRITAAAILTAAVAFTALGAGAQTHGGHHGGQKPRMHDHGGAGTTRDGGAGHAHGMSGMKMLDSHVHQGMEVMLMAADAEMFYLVQGDRLRAIERRPEDSLHLMVMLRDREQGWGIPNTAVWATVKDAGGRVVFDERLWPMLAERIHYGNNVALPAAGAYTIEVQVGVPQLARHAPYHQRWLEPFTVTFDYDHPAGGPPAAGSGSHGHGRPGH